MLHARSRTALPGAGFERFFKTSKARSRVRDVDGVGQLKLQAWGVPIYTYWQLDPRSLFFPLVVTGQCCRDRLGQDRFLAGLQKQAEDRAVVDRIYCAMEIDATRK